MVVELPSSAVITQFHRLQNVTVSVVITDSAPCSGRRRRAGLSSVSMTWAVVPRGVRGASALVIRGSGEIRHGSGLLPFLARRPATAFQSPHSAGASRGILPLSKPRITELHKLNMLTLDTNISKIQKGTSAMRWSLFAWQELLASNVNSINRPPKCNFSSS
jgi:hypothetical protein